MQAVVTMKGAITDNVYLAGHTVGHCLALLWNAMDAMGVACTVSFLLLRFFPFTTSYK